MTVKNIKNLSTFVWENLQLLTLGLTIAGQVIIGANYLTAQAIWFIANVISLARDFALNRPLADKIRDAGLTALTVGLVTAYLMGFYN